MKINHILVLIRTIDRYESWASKTKQKTVHSNCDVKKRFMNTVEGQEGEYIGCTAYELFKTKMRLAYFGHTMKRQHWWKNQ